MADWSDPRGPVTAYPAAADVRTGATDAGLRAHMLSVYNYMASGVLLTGIVDPDSRMHGLDESVDLGDFEKAAVAEALFLARLGR